MTFMDRKKQDIVRNMVVLAPFEGWTEYALKEAAKHSNITKTELAGLLPGGVREVVRLFHMSENTWLADQFASESLNGLRIPEKLEKIILTRFEGWLPKREAVKRLVSYSALPWNMAAATTSLYETVDLFWRLAGDRATDFNFYTKRLTLAGVYSSTLLFWLHDISDQQQETRLFLKRRLADVAEFGRFKQKVTAWVA